MFCKLHKYILQLEQIHFLLLTNTFYSCATRHHIPWLSSGNIQTLPGHVLLTLQQPLPPTYYLVIFILLLRSYLFRLIFATLHCQPLYPKFFPGWDFLEQIILSKCSGFAARAVCHEGLCKTTLEQDYAALPSYSNILCRISNIYRLGVGVDNNESDILCPVT